MSIVIDKSERFRLPRGEKPRFHSDPAIDDLMTMIVALASEVSVLRERLDTHERLAERKGVFSVEEVDHYEPGPEVHAKRAALRSEIVDMVFRPILAAEADTVDETNASVIAEIEGDAGINGSAGF
jgi:hypothetical protein